MSCVYEILNIFFLFQWLKEAEEEEEDDDDDDE
jgi:hypothetical protein